MEIKQYNCKTCGGVLKYNESNNTLICEYCNNKYNYDDGIKTYIDRSYCEHCHTSYYNLNNCPNCNNNLTKNKIGVRTIVDLRNIDYEVLKYDFYIKYFNKHFNPTLVRGKLYDGNILITFKYNGKEYNENFILYNSFVPDIPDLTDNQIKYYLNYRINRKNEQKENFNGFFERTKCIEYKNDNSKRVIGILLKDFYIKYKDNISDIKIYDNIKIENKVYGYMYYFENNLFEKEKVKETINKLYIGEIFSNLGPFLFFGVFILSTLFISFVEFLGVTVMFSPFIVLAIAVGRNYIKKRKMGRNFLKDYFKDLK